MKGATASSAVPELVSGHTFTILAHLILAQMQKFPICFTNASLFLDNALSFTVSVSAADCKTKHGLRSSSGPTSRQSSDEKKMAMIIVVDAHRNTVASWPALLTEKVLQEALFRCRN